MAQSSVQGGNATTSGSDAGTLPPLRTIFTGTTVDAAAALSIRPSLDDLDEVLFNLLEKAATGGRNIDPEQFAQEVSKVLVINPLGTLGEVADLVEYLDDLDSDGLGNYIIQWMRLACRSTGDHLLSQEATDVIIEFLPSLVRGAILQADGIKTLPSTAGLLKAERWRRLTAKRELAAHQQSPFSNGWWVRSLQQDPPQSAFQTPLSESGQVTLPPPPSSTQEVSRSSRRLTLSESSTPDSVSQEKRQAAAKDADKAALSFDGGPFKRVGDPRGFSGFWTQLEGKLLRRGWDYGSPEHFYFLTSLLPEKLVTKSVGKTAPKTFTGFDRAVRQLYQSLSREYGGSVEVEKLLSRTIIRGPKETLTDFVGRLDDWEDQCSTAGSPLPDATLIRAYRLGVNNEASKEASYEYPCDWVGFRNRAVTRAARVDGEVDLRTTGEATAATHGDTKALTAPTPRAALPKPAAERRALPRDPKEVCRNHLKGRCFRGERCRFRHIDKEACRFWAERGRCDFGESCRFKHSSESSSRTPPSGDRPSAPSGGRRPEQLHAVVEDEAAGGEDEEVQRIWAVSEHKELTDAATPKQSGPILRLRFPDGAPALPALLDSGAVRNYVTAEEAKIRGWTIEPVTAYARLANNQKIHLTGRASARVIVDGEEKDVVFYIIPRESGHALAPPCILGVRSMCDLGVSLQFACKDGDRYVVVKQSSYATPCPEGILSKHLAPQTSPCDPQLGGQEIMVLGETLSIVASKADDEEALYCLGERSVEADGVQSEESPLEVTANLSEGRKTLGFEWQPVRAAPDYSVRLRQLDSSEVRDCEGQTHAVEATWDMSVHRHSHGCQGTTKRVFDYSTGLYNRLGADQQAAFDAEIDKFTSRGWWEPGQEEAQDPAGAMIPEAIAFPVVQGKKTRPCVDMRRANSGFPASSYSGQSCSVILAQLRVAIAQASMKARASNAGSRLAMVVMDAETAFYRVRLSGITAQVRCLGHRYKVGRLLFGHRAGPAILEEAMSRLISAAVRKVRQDGMGPSDVPLCYWAYVDDLTLLGEISAVKRLYSAIVSVGASWGFTFSENKTHTITFTVDGHCNEFKDFRHLGVQFACVPCEGGQTIRLRCVPPSFSAQTVVEGAMVSKREAFRWAGAGYDVLGLHPEGSLAADLIRRVAGKWPTSSWDEKTAASADDAKTITIGCAVLAKRTAHCEHSISFSADTLTIRTDASPYGMGYHAALQGPFEEPVCLLAKAKCWKGSQVSWHQNRQEAYCLGLSFVFCDSLIPYVSGLQLRFLTDSRTALSWMRGGEKMTSRSIERIAISRLCEAVADLKEAWVRRFGVHPIVEHISAAQNADADTLSRFASAWKIPPAVVFDGRFSDPKSRGRFPPTVLAPEDATDDSDMEAMATLLLIISEERVYYIPENLDAAIGRPARLELLALQERSSESRELVSKIRGAGNSDVPVSTKRGDFICTEDGILLRRSRPIAESRGAPARLCFYIPSDLPEAVDYAKKLLQTYHIESGCLNARYVRWIFSRSFFISGMRRLAHDVCRSCDKCQFAHNRRYYSLLDGGRSLTHGIRGCWEVVSADLAEMGPDRKGNFTSALFLIDHFSRFVLVAPLRSSSSSAVVGALSSFIDTFGPMSLLRTDRGPCFRGRKLADFLAAHSIAHQLVAPHAPFSNGLVERSISAIKFVTRQLASKRSWSTQLHRVIARLNAKPLDGLDTSPHEVFFGRPRRFSIDNALQNPGPGAAVPADQEEVQERRQTSEFLDRLVADALKASEAINSERRSTRRRGPPSIGSEVLVFTPNPLGGGTYGREVFRVHGIKGPATLQLVKSSVQPAVVTRDMIKEVHYFNTRPYYRSSGGHVNAPQ